MDTPDELLAILADNLQKRRKALGYSKSIKELLSEPIYNTMEELETINKNKNRKKGRNEISK